MKKRVAQKSDMIAYWMEEIQDSMLIIDDVYDIKIAGNRISKKLFSNENNANENFFNVFVNNENSDNIKNTFINVLKNQQPDKLNIENLDIMLYLMPIKLTDSKRLMIIDCEALLYPRKIEHDLQERLKELECLYSISSEIDRNLDIPTLLKNSVKHLMKGFQYPELAVAYIEFDEKKYGVNFKNKNTIKTLTENITCSGKKRGFVKLAYTEEQDFLIEEEKLIEEVAKTISKAIERYELQEELKEYVDKLEELVRKKTKELEKSKTTSEQLFECAPDGVAISTLEGDIIIANKAFYKMLKYPVDGSIKLNYVTDKLYENIPKTRPYIYEKLDENGFLEGFEFNLIDRDGNQCPIIGSFIYIEVDGKKCVEAIYKDNRVRKELERKLIEQKENLEKIVAERTKDLEKQKDILLRKNKALINISEKCRTSRIRLETLFNAITDTVLMIDNDFNIKESNQKDIDKKMKCHKLVFGLDSPCDDCPAKKVFKEKKPISDEKKIDDEYYLLHAYPIFDSKGKIEGVLEFSKQITKEKNLEIQLQQTDKMASLGQLVSGIAHEINNPNTFIRGNLTIVNEAMNDILPILDKYYESNDDLKIARIAYNTFKENILVLINDMVNGSNRIKSIVEDLRQFAKKDEGLLTDDLNVNSIIETALRLVGNQLKRKTRIDLNLNNDIPTIYGNSQKFEQVIVNMLLNAAQSIEKKDGIITITTDINKKQNSVLIIISDNGIGMDEKTQKHIFDPFFTTKRNKGGTGLGLSIAYGIIKDHKGKINIESVQNEGTTFTIQLPIS